MDIETWRINYELHRDPHDLATYWRDGAPAGCALALKATVDELEMMREAMEQVLSWCDAGRPIHAARLARAALEESRMGRRS